MSADEVKDVEASNEEAVPAVDEEEVFDAVRCENIQVLRDLLSHSADAIVHIRNKSDQTALFAAAEKGNAQVVDLLLSHGADVNVTDKDGQTALFAAAKGCSVQVVNLLLSHGADVKVTDEYGQTAFFAAVKGCNVEVVDLLLNHGADVKVTDEDGQTALFVAAKGCSVQVVNLLLSHGADVKVTDWNLQTVLFPAASQGNIEIVQSLLDHGADVKVFDDYGETPLFAAAKGGSAEIVKVFLSKGVDVMTCNLRHQTALFDAAEGGNAEVVELLLPYFTDAKVINQFGQTPLFAAARGGNTKVVQLLLDHGLSVKIMDDGLGQTALLAAAEENNTEVVKLLVSHGADLNVMDRSGQTALLTAVKKDNIELVQFLLSYDADVNHVGKDISETALINAIVQNNKEVVQLLLSHGADVKSALFSAAKGCNTEIVQLLLDHNADAKEISQNGQTTLFAAAEGGSVEIVQLLLNRGADVKAVDKSGRTALFSAAYHGNVKVVHLLLSCGADVKVMDGDGRTVLFLAQREGNVEVVQLLLNHNADVKVIDNHGQNVLFPAAETGDAEIVKLLLQHNADVKVVDHHDQTALFIAAKFSYAKVNRLLSHYGADVYKKCNTDLLIAVAEKGNAEVVQLLLSHGADVRVLGICNQTALFAAAMGTHHLYLYKERLKGSAKYYQGKYTCSGDVVVTDGDIADLCAALDQGIAKVVQLLLRYGADVNTAVWPDGRTALFEAAKGGCAEVVQLLLSHGAVVNAVDKSGQTPLFAAIEERNVEVVQLLLCHGADVMVTGNNGQTLFYAAMKKNNAKIVQLLFSHGVPLSQRFKDGETALFVAVGWGNDEIVQFLLSHGADVNATDLHGQTALFSFGIRTYPKVLQLLLNHGADVNVISDSGATPLSFAIESGYCINPTVELLLSHGAYANVSSEQGSTLLLCAVQRGDIATCQSLLKHGAKPHFIDKWGTPLIFHTAQILESERNVKSIGEAVIQIVKLLVSHGASVHTRNTAGETLLLWYFSQLRESLCKSRFRHLQEPLKVCSYLIKEKVDVNARTHTGHSVIHLALLLLRDVLMGYSEDLSAFKNVNAKCLLELICSILNSSSYSESIKRSRDDEDGNTPLHLWASLAFSREQNKEGVVPGNTDLGATFDSSLGEIARQLLKWDYLRVNDANKNGETPLHLAQTWSAVEFLLKMGALANASDIHGNTPLLKHFHLEMMQILWGSSSTGIGPPYDSMKAKSVKMQWDQILSTGMDPWKGNDDGTTVLSLLLQAGFFEVIKAFLEATGVPYGQDIPVDSNGDTPLHVICRDSGERNFWKLTLVDLLVQSGAHIANRLTRKGETALHLLCKRKKTDQLSTEMIQRLRAYGSQADIPDYEGKTCCDIAVDMPELTELLTQDIKLFDIDPWLPWSSKSEKHKDLLALVARGQKSQQIGSLHYHTDPIGFGAFGHVYAGIDSKDGREVAVKRIEKVRMCRPEDRREINNLLGVTDCEHAVRYLSVHGDQVFLYIVLELMEGTLEELLDGSVEDEKLVLLCTDVLKGLTFLHEKDIIHRDIKPGNILYNRSPKLLLKLADFGLSGKAANVSVQTTTTVMHSKAGTRCWMAPEILRNTAQYSKASDVFACGLVLHYILSRKKHPFGPESESEKSVFVIQNETEANIINNKLMIDGDLSPEPTDLVKLMLSDNTNDRPSADEALQHPLFWSNYKKWDFLAVVGNEHEVKQPRHTVHSLSLVERDIENVFGHQFATNPWRNEIPAIYADMTSSKKSRKYHANSAVDLLRFIRNTHAHVSDLPQATRKCVLEDWVFLDKFPTLLMEVYKAVTKHGWKKRQSIAIVIEQP